MRRMIAWWMYVVTLMVAGSQSTQAQGLRVGVFNVDASPPVGSWMAYDPTTKVLIPLSARGIVILGADAPVVLSSVDWLGIGNGGQREFREAMADAAGTTFERTAIHTVHQHDAIWCDPTVDALCAENGLNYRPFDTAFARVVMQRVREAVVVAIASAEPVTHVGLGEGIVEKVASNRRVQGPDGRVIHVRWSSVKDEIVRAFPEGTIDPVLKMMSFWNGEKPLVAVSLYATHPQSYYRTGEANPDFPGIARNLRQEATGVPHLHFNGAGGNITAGKYNDAAHENRAILAERVAAGMERAWKTTIRTPIELKEVAWKSVPVHLPPAKHLREESLASTLADPSKPQMERFCCAQQLAWLRRCHSEDTIDVACLSIGKARLITMPGELFVEYQLAAQRLRPDLFVGMASYGEYAPAYIGTAVSYGQGGYETQPDSSHVAPESEGILMRAVAQVLDVDPSKVPPLR